MKINKSSYKVTKTPDKKNSEVSGALSGGIENKTTWRERQPEMNHLENRARTEPKQITSLVDIRRIHEQNNPKKKSSKNNKFIGF